MESTIRKTMTTSMEASSGHAFTKSKVDVGQRAATIGMLLKAVFSIVPVVAGLDKFTNLLTNWENYLNPMLAQVLPVSPHAFMMVVGVIEIIAGVIVYYRPRVGALIVSGWLTCVALSLLASGQYLDVAVRDLVMAVSAFTLAYIAPAIESMRGNRS